MTKINEIYRCNVCGNIVEMVHAGVGELICCGQPMELLIERQTDVGPEKHIPIIENTKKGIKVKVGEVPHPMEENHYIEWVELIIDGKTYREFLEPGDDPEVEFNLNISEDSDLKVREYCNIHGLWHS
ncbi:desulfoferrodoxin [Methanobacterium alkalithermotolerans]|uniref:Desulfoferrodoxin n=1 Tax=Methanobacterium alkalithermotolerans TaxID=2731220 RepID=A0A8T8K355_9EURY|nr:desulfoferrodoxin [Methanobacterium alkalithermotolerans]MDI6725132.1 desulfoferrodoxin [Methanobacterium sp.]MDI6882812.1 desulfoferrodoxin [Methanothermobacter sp.]QUH22834.1 desulfoferrodoxin [Methanobacterium alkalithermotolerans]